MVLPLPVVGAILMSGTGDTAAAFDIAAIMTNSVNKVQGDVFTVLGIVTPVIAVVTAAVVGVIFGLKWLKKIGK